MAATTRTSMRVGRAAEPLDLPFLEHPQQLGLQLQRQLADLVEEDGPAVGQLEAAGLRGERAGERAALAAEELALDQRPGQRAAVDHDEVAVAPRAALVDRARHELLARARLAEEEHGGVRGRDLLDAVHHVLSASLVPTIGLSGVSRSDGRTAALWPGKVIARCADIVNALV